MRLPDCPADDALIDSLAERLAALDDCLHGVDPGTTKLSATTHAAAGLAHPEFGDAVDAILMLRQAAAASRCLQTDDDPPLPRQIGRFELVRLAGSGGFARVAEAIDPLLNRRVAVKVPRAEAMLAPGLRRRFLREAEIAARLSHPHIVTIHEVGEADGLAYIAQELCAGGSLAEWLEQHPGPLPTRVAVHLVLTLARAVAYAHDEGVIHRDIKPANVLLVPALSGDPVMLPPGMTVKLGDFGLGKASSAADDEHATQLTQTGARVGTPTWMAPEQVDATIGPVGPWSDIHSLGLLLDRLLTGRCLRGGRTDAETFRQILLDDPPPCDRVQAGVSRDLGAVCLACLAKNPRERYGSARELAADLERALDGRPTVARPLSPAARLGRAVLRRPLAASLAACLLAAVGLAGWAAGERSRERARHAATAADMRRHEAATALRRGFDAFRTGNAGAALGHLDACRQIDASLALSFAGRWLERRLHGEQALLLPHEGAAGGSLHDVCVSPDGTLFAAGAADGTLFIGPLDATSGRGVQVVRQAHDEINGMAFSPDGRAIATVGQDGVLRLWHAADGAALQKLPAAGAPLYGVAFAVDGSFIATGGVDRRLTVWPLTEERISAAEPRTIPLADSGDGEIEWLCPLPGTRLAVALGRDVLVVDVRPGGGSRVLARYDEVVARLAVSADGRLLAIVGHARSPLVVRVSDGALVRTLPLHPSWIDGCEFSPDGTKLVTAGKDGVARLYDIASGALEQRFVGHVGRVWDAQFDRQGRVLTAGADGTLRCWDARTPPDLAGVVVVPHAGVRAMAVAAEPAGRDRIGLLVGYDTVSADPTLKPSISGQIDRLDPRSGACSPLPLTVPASMKKIVVDPDGDRLVALPTKLPVVTYAVQSATVGALPAIAGEPAIVGCCAAVAADGLVFIGCKGGRLVAWSPPAARAVVIARFDKDLDCLACAPASSGLLAAGSRRQVRLYDVADLSRNLRTSPLQAVRTLPDLPGDVQALAWSPDGTRLVCGMNDGLVMVFDSATGQTVGTLAAHERDLIGAAYLADGRTLVTADNENIRISDATTLATLDEIRPGWRVFDLCVLGDGSGVAVVGGLHESAAHDPAPTGRIGLVCVEPLGAEGPP